MLRTGAGNILFVEVMMLVLAGLMVSGVPRSAEVGSGRGDDHAPALVGHHEVDRDEQCPIVHNWADYRGGWTGEVTQGRQHRYPHTCNSSNIDNQVRKPSVTLSSSDTEPVVKDLGWKIIIVFWLRSTILLSLFDRKTENFEWAKATFPFSQKWRFRCPKRKSRTTFFNKNLLPRTPQLVW